MIFFWKKRRKRRLLIPEVVQTSAMDCGPASLKSLFEGHHIPISYGRLREACQTDVDGTSIDELEDVALKLGLDAEQIMIPLDHIFVKQAHALPALVVVCLPDGATHFVVIWNVFGHWVQVMDPATGRRWLPQRQFLNDVYKHTFAVDNGDWREWAGSDEFLLPLSHRLDAVLDNPNMVKSLIEKSLNDPSWSSLARLDAAARMCTAIVDAGGVKRGQQCQSLMLQLLEKAVKDAAVETEVIPDTYWSVRPVADKESQLNLRGAVLLRVSGQSERDAEQVTETSAKHEHILSPELEAALHETSTRPLIELFTFIRKEGTAALLVLLFGFVMAAAFLLLEALIFRGLIDGWDYLKIDSQRMGGIVMVVLFALGLLLLELSRTSGVFRLGRKLEIRLRSVFLDKIPKLTDRYFSSRPISDMAHRSHLLHILRTLPDLVSQLVIVFFEIIITMIGIMWIAPRCWALASAATFFCLLTPLCALPFLNERDMRLQTHNGALGKFYLDALLGLTPIRIHSAEAAVQREHEGLTVEWGRAGLEFHRMMVIVEGLQMISGFTFAILILNRYLSVYAESSWVLLLVYWSLNLPVLGQYLVSMLQQFPMHRNTVSRFLEPLDAPEQKRSDILLNHSPQATGVAISFDAVDVSVSGHTVLQDVNLNIESGRHVAILGASGAGKSTLVGLLLGWHRPSTGSVKINRVPISDCIEQLNQETVWIDPTVHIWNRSLYENIMYGSFHGSSSSMEHVLNDSNLMDVLQILPNGMQTVLGESGGLLSGGEAQRLRIARAMNSTHPKLVLLDEPCRGLESTQRREITRRMRQRWASATLICVTHDVEEALTFDRVVVLEHGQIAESGVPHALKEKNDSVFNRLLNAEKKIRRDVWTDRKWRKLFMQQGLLKEDNGE